MKVATNVVSFLLGTLTTAILIAIWNHDNDKITGLSALFLIIAVVRIMFASVEGE